MLKAENALTEAGIEYLINEPMKKHTSFKIGGDADLFVLPKNGEEAEKAVKIAENSGLPVTVIGNGSNLLVSDYGIEGMVICLENSNEITVDGCTVTVKSGAMLSRFAAVCAANSLTGAEFAAGIPGSIGGAVFMNAGAYGGEIKDIVKKVTALKGGKVRTYSAEECDFGYRKSIFLEGGYIILEAEFELKQGNEEEIRSVMKELAARRRNKQPLEFPSAGSTFKRPEGYFAGALIEGAGLKGFSVGGAQVSEKHAGFVINRGGASCEDVKALIEAVKKKVYDNSGVMLEEEIKAVGRTKRK